MNGDHKVHILHSGTEILQFTPSEDAAEDVGQLSRPPKEGVICFVLKNGFETKQGKLMRVILFSQDRVSVESPEVYLYLLILLVFALVASHYVLVECLKDPDRSRYKIMLRCILIITNVVPPELPMQLSMAVNYSIIQLIQKQIFCTEPYRIPLGGKVNICCFDKTGTLTQCDLQIKGVLGLGNTAAEQERIMEMSEVFSKDKNTAFVIGGAHTLALTDGNLIGDPIEKQVFEGIKFRQAADGSRVSSGPHVQITQVKKYMFSSALKRMSVLAQIADSTGTSLRVLSKGAPEVLKQHMKTLPANYDETYLKYVKHGARVLAMAYKPVPKMMKQEQLAYKREEAEEGLIFCGFIIAECPLKEDTKAVIVELKEASHEVKMITGDNALTAAFIGQELTFGNGPSLFARDGHADNKLTWYDLDDKKVGATSSASDVAALAKQNMLCINGDVLGAVILHSECSGIIRHIDIFSRTSPAQKGIIVGMLNLEGNQTLMCGDGTNDVGSLKRADVGLAIVNNKELTKEQKAAKKAISMWPPKEKLAGKTLAEQAKVQQEHMEEMKKKQAELSGGMDAQLELGDACIAAPFTYKFQSLKSVKRVIRQGRSTLTTTFQMYKILSLNCLISAYTMSALYLDGVKMGDYQATALGLGISFLFMTLSFGKPLKKLQKERPPTSIFHWSLVISVSVQFVVHLSVLIHFVNLCEPHIDRDDESLAHDAEFAPNLKNSVMYVYQWWLQTTVILVNYSGRPFTQDISENLKLKRMLMLMFGLAACLIFDVSEDLRDFLELVPFPSEEFQQEVIFWLVVDLALCYAIEKTMKTLYLRTFRDA